MMDRKFRAWDKAENPTKRKGKGWYRENGYVLQYAPYHPHANKRGYVMEHRLIMENNLGRYLIPRKEIVHHINGVRDDNEPNNLKLSNPHSHEPRAIRGGKMKHVHADLMLEYARDAQETDKPWERWQWRSGSSDWCTFISNPNWYDDFEYRRIDPYRKFREAQERGEVVQFKLDNGKWYGDGMCHFDLPVEQYRIKPKTKKMWKWIYIDKTTGVPKETDYHESEENAKADILWGHSFQRLDYTAIEVEA